MKQDIAVNNKKDYDIEPFIEKYYDYVCDIIDSLCQDKADEESKKDIILNIFIVVRKYKIRDIEDSITTYYLYGIAKKFVSENIKKTQIEMEQNNEKMV